MAQPATAQPATALGITPAVVIQITNGVPDKPSVQILNGQAVGIKSTDNTYLLEFFANGNAIPIGVVITQAQGSGVILPAMINDITITYNVATVPLSSARRSREVSTGGAYSIKVGTPPEKP